MWRKYLIISVFLNILFFLFICNRLNYEHKLKHQPIIIEKVAEEMDDWGIFTMALMSVESKYDSSAVSSAGAKGYFQITPIYVKEVNRIHNTNFTMDDVYTLENSYVIFDLMQQAHNQDYDMDRALTLHNGNHKWYKKRVMDEYERIKKYENLRNRLINLNNSEKN